MLAEAAAQGLGITMQPDFIAADYRSSGAVETVLGGQVFPLDLLEKNYPIAFEISQYLPYYYQMYFPAAILSGRLDLAQAQHGLVVQLVWVIALLGLAQLLWTRGLRRHTAVGG